MQRYVEPSAISSFLGGFQVPLGTLICGEPAAVNARAVSMWVQTCTPSDGTSAATLQNPHKP